MTIIMVVVLLIAIVCIEKAQCLDNFLLSSVASSNESVVMATTVWATDLGQNITASSSNPVDYDGVITVKDNEMSNSNVTIWIPNSETTLTAVSVSTRLPGDWNESLAIDDGISKSYQLDNATHSRDEMMVLASEYTLYKGIVV